MLRTNDQPEVVRHPAVARLQRRLSGAPRRARAADHRQRLLADLRGHVLEVGSGSGASFAHYPTTATRLIAIEPEPRLRAAAIAAGSRSPIPVTVLDGTADAVPLDDESVDVAVVSLVLCSVPDQATALAELRRVVKPGGQVRFYEHVAADDPGLSRRQHRADRMWSLLAGGCHLTRNTEQALRDAGFDIEDCDRFPFRPCRLTGLTSPHVLGRARRP